MSTDSVQPFNVVGIQEPITNINSSQQFVIMKGGKYFNVKDFTTTSFSTSSFNFSCPPPSPQTVVDRLILLTTFVQLVFDQPPILGSTDSLRQFPIMSNMLTMQTTINNTTLTQNPYNYVQALMKYDLSNDKIAKTYSETAAYDDQYQDYSQWTTYGSARNPMAFIGENSATMSRGAFQPSFISVDGKTLQYKITEALYLQSPFIWDDSDQHQGYVNVNTMDFIFTLSPNLSRMWSHDATNGNAITNITVTFPQSPLLRFFYSSLQDTVAIPQQISYPYYPIDRYISSGLTLAPGASGQITTNNVQLNQIPECVFHFVQITDSAKTFSTSDTYAVITNLNVQFNNMTGLLSSADINDLYKLCRRNGSNQSYQQFSNFQGSVVRLNFGTDIQLPPQLAPSVLGNYNYQITVNFTNTSPNTIQYDVFTVFVYSGTFTVSIGSAIPQTGIISPVSVLESSDLGNVDYLLAKKLEGGNVFGKLKSFIGNVSKGAQAVGKYGKLLAPQYSAPLTALEAIGTVGRDLTGMGRMRRRRRGRKVYRRRRGRGLVGGNLNEESESGDEYEDEA